MLTLEKQIERLKAIHRRTASEKNVYVITQRSIWVNGDIDLSHMELETIPFKFGRVNGNFQIDHNKLKTLENCPTYVKGNFICSHNDITDLQGGPSHVTGNYDCNTNLLTSLKGQPLYVGEHFSCYNNPNLKELTVIKTDEFPNLKSFYINYISSDFTIGGRDIIISNDDLPKEIHHWDNYAKAVFKGCRRVYQEIPELISEIPNVYLKIIKLNMNTARQYGIFEYLKKFKEF